MKKSIFAVFLLASSLSAQVQLGKYVQIGGAGTPLTLTTTGSSGPATYTGGILNIPQYTGGSSLDVKTNSTDNISQTVLNFTDGNGFAFTNPSGGVQKIAADGSHYLPTTTDQTNWNAKQAAGSYMTSLTGDATASGPGAAAVTLATVNSTPGTCGDATHVCVNVTNGKGLVTGQTPVAITGTGVTSFKGRTGAVIPVVNDYAIDQISNLNTTVPPAQALNPLTIQANSVMDANYNQWADGTPYYAAGPAYAANGMYIDDMMLTCLSNPEKCSASFLLNAINKFVANKNGAGEFPIAVAQNLSTIYFYSGADAAHLFATGDGRIMVPQALYLYCLKVGTGSSQCTSAYTANVAAIKAAWAATPRNGTTHLYTVVANSEYVCGTAFQEYMRNTGDVAGCNVWAAIDDADMLTLATAAGDATNVTFFTNDLALLVAGIRANLIDGSTGLLVAATIQNVSNDDIPSSALAVFCDNSTVMAPCGILTSGQKTTIETYFKTNYATLVNSNGYIQQTPKAGGWTTTGCIPVGGGPPYNTSGGACGASGTQYQGGFWTFHFSWFATALAQVAPVNSTSPNVGTLLSLYSGTLDPGCEYFNQGSGSCDGTTPNLESPQGPKAAFDAFPTSLPWTPSTVPCQNQYGALYVATACIMNFAATFNAMATFNGGNIANAAAMTFANTNPAGSDGITFVSTAGGLHHGTVGMANPSFTLYPWLAGKTYLANNSGDICLTGGVVTRGACDLLIAEASGFVGIGGAPTHVLDLFANSSATTLTSTNTVEAEVTNTNGTINTYEAFVGKSNNASAAAVTMSKLATVNAAVTAAAESADLHFLLRNAGTLTDWVTLSHIGTLSGASWSLTSAGALIVASCTGCGGGGTPAYPLTVTGAVSGGVVYGNSTTQLTVSPAGTANTLMKWGGAGLPPTISAILDNGTTVTLTENLVINVAGNGNTCFGTTSTMDTCINRSAAGVLEADDGTLGSKNGVYYAKRFREVPFTITFSATPTIDMTNGSMQTITMTGNITGITVTNITAGDMLSLQFCQDATGSRTLAGATLLHGIGTIGSTLSTCSQQEFKSYTGTTFVAMGTMVTGVAP